MSSAGLRSVAVAVNASGQVVGYSGELAFSWTRAGGMIGLDTFGMFLDRIDRSPSLRLEFVTAERHARARAWLAKLADRIVTYTDAVSFAVVEATRCSAVLTFDDDFTVAGFRRFTG